MIKLLELIVRFVETHHAIIITAILNSAIVLMLVIQNRIAKLNLRISEKSEKRVSESEKPNIKLEDWSSTNQKSIKRVGFIVTNASKLDSTISRVGLLVGIKEDGVGGLREITSNPSVSEYLIEDQRWREYTSDHRKRMRQGDSILAAYRFDNLHMEEKDGKHVPVRVQAYCRDSLGNTFLTPFWIEFKETSTILWPDPGPGYLSGEEMLERVRGVWNVVLPSE